MKHITLVALFALASCASKPLTEEEKSVRIMRKNDPDAKCAEIKKVHSPGLGAMTEQGREDNLKRAAFEVGGDTVTIDRTDENNTIFGTAFKCRS